MQAKLLGDVGGRHGEKANALAKAIVGHADGCLVADVFPVHHVVVDFARGNVFSAANDDFLLATIDAHALFFVDRAQIAGIEPSLIVERFIGALGIVEVAAEHVGATARFLALNAMGDFVAEFVHDLHFDAGIGNAREPAVPFEALVARNAQVGAAFG